MLKIITPAEDLSLVTMEAMRAAAGVPDGDTTRDLELEALGLRLSAEIVSACRVAVGNGGEPTLRQETLEETFRYPQTTALMLARRHQVEIESLTINGQALPAEQFWADEESGIVRRIPGFSWAAALVVVTYQAGFEDVPPDLVGAVIDLARVRLSEAARDPLVKGSSVEVPDVMTTRTDYWVGAVPGGRAGGIPAQISAQLRRYKNVAFV